MLDLGSALLGSHLRLWFTLLYPVKIVKLGASSTKLMYSMEILFKIHNALIYFKFEFQYMEFI